MAVVEEMDEMEVTQDVFGLLELLKNHYGDGQVYLPDGASQDTLDMARTIGYINDEGYLTRAGRKLVAQQRTL